MKKKWLFISILIVAEILVLIAVVFVVWQGVGHLAVYSLGMAAPFVIMSIFIGLLFAFIKKAAKAIRYINALAGTLLIFMGILLLTNKLYLLYTPI